MIITEQQRATALEAMALYLREVPESTFEPVVQRLIDAKFANSKVITLLDLLEGAARESAPAIDFALSEAGLSLGSVLQTIRERLRRHNAAGLAGGSSSQITDRN